MDKVYNQSTKGEGTMKLAKTRIWEAATKDKDRPTLQGVHYNAEKGRLEACDGFILAVTPVVLDEDEQVEGGIVPAAAVKEAHKLGAAISKVPTLETENGNFVPGFVSAYPDGKEGGTGPAYQPIEGHYPNVDRIMPSEAVEEQYEYVVTLDVKKLYRLARAICEDKGGRSTADLHVRLYVDKSGNSTPVIVKPQPTLCNKGTYGLIMPVYDEVS
jgi:DNA polymerase III sliding clamp (beta) subunit (PCNA family)